MVKRHTSGVTFMPVRDAALANGMLIHGLDFDDTHLSSIIHATAACLPCALSFGEARGIDGKTLLIAYAAGRMRRFFIRITPGDRIRVELSPYDLTRGRIVYRYK